MTIEKIDNLIVDIIREQAPSDEVAVLMSGGVDSLTCAFAATRIGKKVNCYTMYVDGKETPDSITSVAAAKTFGWDIKLIDVPVKNIKDDFKKLIRSYDCVKKTQVECTFPFLYVYPHIKEKHIISGVAADGWYGVSKRACIHYKHTKELFDEFRNNYFGSSNPAGVRQQEQLSKEIDANLISPYLDDKVGKWMMQHDWDFFNKPFQKANIIKAFPEFKTFGKNRKHANLQLVAGIPEYFEQLLNDKKLNFRNRKRVMDLIRDWVKVPENNIEGFLS